MTYFVASSHRACICGVMVLGVMVLGGVHASAQGVLTFHTTQASFNAATTQRGTDTFNSMGLGAVASPVVRSAGGYTLSAGNPQGAFFFNVGSASDVWLSTENHDDQMVFNGFSPSVQAVGGFFFPTLQSGAATPGIMTMWVTDASGVTTQTFASGGSVSFFGVVSTAPILEVRIASVQPAVGRVWPGANDLTLGQAIPTPSALVSAAALMLLGARRRR
jgi:hypothetical protein